MTSSGDHFSPPLGMGGYRSYSEKNIWNDNNSEFGMTIIEIGTNLVLKDGFYK